MEHYTPCPTRPSWHWCCVNDQRVLILLPLWMNIGQFKMFWRVLFEGRWYTGRNFHQIWAEWAVHGSCYLLKDSPKYFNFMEIIWYNAWTILMTSIGQNSLIILQSSVPARTVGHGVISLYILLSILILAFDFELSFQNNFCFNWL